MSTYLLVLDCAMRFSDTICSLAVAFCLPSGVLVFGIGPRCIWMHNKSLRSPTNFERAAYRVTCSASNPAGRRTHTPVVLLGTSFDFRILQDSCTTPPREVSASIFGSTRSHIRHRRSFLSWSRTPETSECGVDSCPISPASQRGESLVIIMVTR